MADFDKAIFYVLADEGGQFTDNPADPGGATKWGITLVQFLKTVPGATLDQLKVFTREQAIQWYRQFRWDSRNFWQINNQDLCNKIFSTFINMDADAIHFVQRALGDYFKMLIKDDGVLGSGTVIALNAVDPARLLQEFRAQQAKHYALWFARAPLDRDQLLLGLMRRAIE